MSFLKTTPCALLLCLLLSGGALADTGSRFERGAQSCAADFINFRDAGETELAAKARRCFERFNARVVLAASKSTRRAILRRRIRGVNRSIRRLKKKIGRSTNLLSIAKMQSTLLDKELRVARLKEKLTKLTKGCSDRKAVLKMIWENNSDYNIDVFIYDYFTEQWDSLGVIGPVQEKTIKISLKKVKNYRFDQPDAYLALRTRINNQDSVKYYVLNESHFNTTKPCVRSNRTVLYDSSFEVPKPKLNYGVYVLEDEHTCCRLDDDTFPYEYFEGQEGSWPDDAIPVATGFASLDALRKWVCSHKVTGHYWAGTQTVLNGYTVTKVPCKIN